MLFRSIALHSPPPPLPEEEPGAAEQAEEGEVPQTGAANTPDQEEEERKQAQRQGLLYTTGGGDDAAATRAALADFEERARTMRSAITTGGGWFEWYFVPRPKRLTAEARDYVARDEAIPPGVQAYEEDDQRPWGPYLRYRWWEGKTKYSLGMGHIKRRWGSPPLSDEPPSL